MDAIHCENDFAYMKDVPHPDDFVEDPNEFAKIKFPSCVMLIHDTIYCSPDDNALRYRSLINNWIRKPPSKKMEPCKNGNWDMKLSELELQFGFPYVYIHLGGCEHIIVFTKSRLLSLEDNHLLKDYPKIHGMTQFKNVYCRVDNISLASWTVVDYKEFPENPMLLCAECVKMYCYYKNKKKQGDFKLYPFTQMASIM
jgi:snRNA-activating protein complex subunit 3